MADHPFQVTVSEASFILERTPKALNQAIDAGEIGVLDRGTQKPAKGAKFEIDKRAVQVGVKRGSARYLGLAELRYFKVRAGLERELTPAGRRKIFQAIKKTAKGAQVVKYGAMELPLAAVDKELKPRIDRLMELKAAVKSAPGGELVLKGTEIPVHEIAALGKGQTVQQILEDYPSLNDTQVQLAIDYAKAYPKAGRPYPTRSAKRRLADLAASGAMDIDPEPITPKMFE